MRPELRISGLALAAALALAGCQGEQKKSAQATAGGEVLPGSASDAMLPVDSLRSQPPLAPKPEASGKSASAGKPGASASEPVPDEAPAPEEAPAAAPETEAAPAE